MFAYGPAQPIAKRRIALLRSLGRAPEAVSALTALLDMSPADAEAWAELADLYLSQGMYPQAIFSLEEVLLLTPNAWNVSLSVPLACLKLYSDAVLQIHARLGEVLFMAATTSAGGEASSQKYLAEAIKRFCRSIELCDDYLRGYYGLKLVSGTLLFATITAYPVQLCSCSSSGGIPRSQEPSQIWVAG